MLSGLPTKNGLLASQTCAGVDSAAPQHIRPALARVAAFGYRIATRADTLGGSAAGGGISRRFGIGTGDERAAFDVSGPALKRSRQKLERKCHEPRELRASRPKARDRVGKGAAREIRRTGKSTRSHLWWTTSHPWRSPCPTRKSISGFHAGGFLTTIATIDVDGEKHQVLPKDFQMDPVRDFTMHVDFLRVGARTPSSRSRFRFTSSTKRARRVSSVAAFSTSSGMRSSAPVPPTTFPKRFEIDLTGLEIGDSIHISAVSLPKGVAPTITDRDFTIATIAAPLPS